MVFDSVAYKSVISNGLVLDKNGNKMSKRLGNAVDPFGAIEKYGTDPLRWYMISNSSPWDNLKFDTAGVEEVSRKFFGTLYNTYSFFALYANVDNFDNSAEQIKYPERPEIDRWILSLLNTLIKEVEADLDDYEPTKAARAISEFVCDNLSNWYVRLNRSRFWRGDMTADKLSAFQTLYKCLETVALLMAPVSPFFADRLYTDLTSVTKGTRKSVHLARFPQADESIVDKILEKDMKLAQEVTSMTLALRRKANLKVRQPLSQIMIPVTGSEQKRSIDAMSQLIMNEVNVKGIRYVSTEDGVLVKKVRPDFKKLGPKFGPAMKQVASAIAAMQQSDIAAMERDGKFIFSLGDTNATVELADVEIISEDIPGWLVANEGSLTVALDITVTEELRNEGIAREIVNRIQNIRKNQGFDITDRIDVVISSNEDTDKAVKQFSDYIARQVLANSLTIGEIAEPDKIELEGLDNLYASVKICK